MFTKLRGRKGRLVGIVAAIPLALGVTVGVVQPAAATSASVKYVALGDSYTAGQGGGQEDVDCFRSLTGGYPSYAVQLGYTVDNRACQGAITLTLLTKQLYRTPDWSVGLVTLTIGGNDAGFSSFGVSCGNELRGFLTGVPVPVSDACRRLLDINRWERIDLTLRLTATYLAIRGAFPNARVVVLGYPHLLPGGAAGGRDLASLLRKATDDLNGIIERAAHRTRVNYVSVVESFDANPDWISLAPGLGFLHPTPAGYHGYFTAVKTALEVPVT
jgi:lysophospholipase L1-like esterase